MEPVEPGDDTANQATRQLLSELTARPHGTFAALTPEFYDRLRRLAQRYMTRERRDHTNQSTATEVLHARSRLSQRGASFADSRAFYLTVAAQIRWFLVDHARARVNRPKQNNTSIPLESDGDEREARFLDLQQALSALERLDPELSDVCDLYYFGGHTVTEIALMLGVTEGAVTRQLRLLKAWLSTYLQHARPGE